jgi:hypothetical protein
VPFFVGLWQAFKVLGYAGRNEELSPQALRSVRTIKRCAIAFLAVVAGAELIILSSDGSDDRAGGVAVGVVVAFATLVVATGVTLLERSLRKAVDLQSEHDLTV